MSQNPNPTQIVEVVQAVIKAQKRIPEELRSWTFFSNMDMWQYEAITDSRTCDICLHFDTWLIRGSELRFMFPDLEIKDENTIAARVHMTLWEKDTCRCLLHRIYEPSHYIAITEERINLD